ncbi:MAG TPA: hypothetical protein VF755_06430 [Catenuloplanes sp.]|jgi:hypothetical protein
MTSTLPGPSPAATAPDPVADHGPAPTPTAPPGRRAWAGALARGRPDDPRWVRPALVALLAGTALLYLCARRSTGCRSG